MSRRDGAPTVSEALKKAKALDLGGDPVLERIVRITAEVCEAPIACLTLVDHETVWVKAKHGLSVTSVPRNASFCGATVQQNGSMFVENALEHPIFANCELVLKAPFVRFYAGAPLCDAFGNTIGTLCILDTKPQELGGERHRRLLELACLAEASIARNSEIFDLRQGFSSELAEVECLVLEQHSKMLRNAKLSALGEMAAGIAHEINNPLAIIHGRAGLLVEKLVSLSKANEPIGRADIEGLARSASKIEETALRIAKIIKALRGLARDGGSEPMRVESIDTIIQGTLEFCAERFRSSGVRFELHVPEPVPDVECRAIQVSQVILNLLNNAFDAVCSLEEKWVRIDAMESGDSVEIAVTDSGPGIDPAVISRIMTPFFTTKATGKGVGLGLSLSQAIAKDHGGCFELDSASPRTRFVLRLPKRQELRKAV